MEASAASLLVGAPLHGVTARASIYNKIKTEA